jgi:hypothetical protein
MNRKKKLKIGDRVYCKFLGNEYIAVVIEVTSPGKYKLQYHCYGSRPTILPNAEWYNPKDKKAAAKPWHIHEYIDSNGRSKTIGNTDIIAATTTKNELDIAIKKQKAFIRGNVKK